MPKNKFNVITMVAWIVGILVSLAVGFGMIGGALIIPKIPGMITIVAGWIVVVMTIIGAIGALMQKFA